MLRTWFSRTRTIQKPSFDVGFLVHHPRDRSGHGRWSSSGHDPLRSSDHCCSLAHSINRSIDSPNPQNLQSSSISTNTLPILNPAIGLELHVQLASSSKLFSSANSSSSDQDSNTNVDLFDAAVPGVQPILSPDCLRLALIASLALDCKINPTMTFDRKHYFYPDLPAGYQITQRYSPIARGGKILITPEDGADRTFEVQITQLHLEQDTAKSFTDPSFPDQILTDLNRSGVPLIEIVTGPDLRTAKEASIFVRKLQSILRFAGITKGNMEQGSLRCDLNVSVSLADSSLQGSRCEVKNVNGFSHIEHAIDFEISRQQALVASGQPIETETRGFDVSQRQTFRLRDKETHTDYRYLPDPDIPPIIIPLSILDRLQALVPELPNAMVQRLQNSYGLTKQTADILMMIGFERIDNLTDVGCGVRYFEAAMKGGNLLGEDGKMVANWIIHELLGHLSKSGLRFVECPICPQEFGELVHNVKEGLVLRPAARQILSEAIKTPTNSVREQLVKILQDVSECDHNPSELIIEKLTDEIIFNLEKEVRLIRNGRINIIGKLVGEAMKLSQQKLDPRLIRKVFEDKLLNSKSEKP